MKAPGATIRMPQLRSSATFNLSNTEVEISSALRRCTFQFAEDEKPQVAALMQCLKSGGYSVAQLSSRLPEISEAIPSLLEDLDRLRLLTDSEVTDSKLVVSGVQLYRELRRIAGRVAQRESRSLFLHSLTEGTATRLQLIGYGLEYFWIVKTAPGLIGPVLGSAHDVAERELWQNFLASELRHDEMIAEALEAVGFTKADLELHIPLPATFSLGAALAVHARQNVLSFGACLFVFETTRPEFVDAFDARCRELDIPEAFFEPFRRHAGINAKYDHEDISLQFLTLRPAIDHEAAVIAKRDVALMIETLVSQESQILEYYGRTDATLPRIFE